MTIKRKICRLWWASAHHRLQNKVKNENVNTEILEKICRALDCDISDIMEMTEDK